MLDAPSKLFGEAIIPDGVYYEGVIRAKKSERVAKIKRSIEEGLIKITKPKKAKSKLQKNYKKLWDLESDIQLLLASLKSVWLQLMI
jgi:hypothetical protein